MKGARGASSRRPFFVALALVAVLGAIGIMWAMQRTKASSVVTIDPRAAAGSKAEGHVMGDSAAPVEIIEFADFECPGCGQFATVTEPDVRERLIKTGIVKFRIYPFQVTTGHPNSVSAALAAECASDQGKFWEMHDRLFAGQTDWNGFATNDPKSIFEKYGQALALDMTAWNACYDGRKYVGRIAANAEEAVRMRVASTPSLIIGDKLLAGAQPYDVIKAAVDSARAKAPAAAAKQ